MSIESGNSSDLDQSELNKHKIKANIEDIANDSSILDHNFTYEELTETEEGKEYQKRVYRYGLEQALKKDGPIYDGRFPILMFFWRFYPRFDFNKMQESFLSTVIPFASEADIRYVGPTSWTLFRNLSWLAALKTGWNVRKNVVKNEMPFSWSTLWASAKRPFLLPIVGLSFYMITLGEVSLMDLNTDLGRSLRERRKGFYESIGDTDPFERDWPRNEKNSDPIPAPYLWGWPKMSQAQIDKRQRIYDRENRDKIEFLSRTGKFEHLLHREEPTVDELIAYRELTEKRDREDAMKRAKARAQFMKKWKTNVRDDE